MLDLICLTNALTDIVIKVSDEEFKTLGLNKGTTNRKSQINLEQFLKFVSDKYQKRFFGGSPGNVSHDAAALCRSVGLLGTVGDDLEGDDYSKHVTHAGITNLLRRCDGSSGICYIIVTPDGEKSNVHFGGVSDRHEYDLDFRARMFHTSGYELHSNPKNILKAIEYAKSSGMKLSFDLADPSIVERRKDIIDRLLPLIDVLFMTEGEHEKLGPVKLPQIAVLKMGAKGSMVISNGQIYEIPIYPAQVDNTNGAGDAYAAGFLNGYLSGVPIKECGNLGSIIAAEVCEREESHISRE